MICTFNFEKVCLKILLIFMSLLWSIGQAQEELSPSRKMDTLFSKYSLNTTPGVAIGIVKDGQLIFSRGYGSANLEYDIPITSKTRFHVASISKQFTAFAIYLLKDQGLLDLNDDIRKYIPEFPNYGPTIRIRHLLAHTSGLRDQWALLTLAGWQLEDVITTEQVLKLAGQQKALNFEPGTDFSYCNTSFTLLSKIVEKVSGLKFSVFTHENIFKPLGMSNTLFYENFHDVVKNRAYSYEKKNNRYVKKKLNYSNVGPTSLFTNVEDLTKWSNNFEHPIVGSKALINEFNEISTLDNGEPVIFSVIKKDTLYHAKGQISRSHRGVHMIKHGGHDAGFRAFLARFPDENMSIITLSNDEHYEIFARGLEIAEFYLESTMGPKVYEGQKPPLIVEKKKEEQISLEPFVGSYHSNELSTTYHIKIQENQLVISHQRLPNMPLTHKRGTKFYGNNYFNFEIDFIKNRNERVTGFEISNFGVRKLQFKKITTTDY